MGKQKVLLIFCAILSQGLASLSDNYTTAEESSVHLLRKKRLIDRTPGGNRAVSLLQFPYIVNVLENGVHNCAGSILSEFVIITAAHCAEGNNFRYRILSGSTNVRNGFLHIVVRILKYPLARRFTFQNDLALLTIHPAIDLIRSPNRAITLFEGHVPPNTVASTTGWGLALKQSFSTCLVRGSGIHFPRQLRSIDVPTISTEHCRHAHFEDPEITEEVICTFDAARQKHCDVGDGGNPLVIHNQLVGVLGWNPHAHQGPDIFVSVIHPAHRNWIMENLLRPHSPLHPVSPRSPNSLQSSPSSRHSPSSFSPPSTPLSPHHPNLHPQPHPQPQPHPHNIEHH